MTLDYVGPEKSGKNHGYVFRRERVTEVGSEGMRVTGGNLDAAGRRVVFLTETRDVLVFRRGDPGVQEVREVEGGEVEEEEDTSFWSFAPDVLNNFDGGIFTGGPGGVKGKSERRSGSGWELVRVFGRDVLREVVGEDIVAFNLIKTSDLDPSVRPKSYNDSSAVEKDNHYMVFLLYEQTTTKQFKFIVLDLSRTYEGTWLFTFVMNKWEMVVGVLAVVGVFCLNEVRMMRPNARPVPPQLYPVIVSSVFFVVIFAALLRD
ncbi:hypothetical protein HK097_001565 [Rhizophlyctis rosea]|uniref:Uncharacterized protein n=1 Tax=Rhizophlyctis rosea TaxID=64517 RepID=A0AAD5X3G4_9FUNG|nr:hypothetical protein HK097_001565 [Rhizophlyctis rosea]